MDTTVTPAFGNVQLRKNAIWYNCESFVWWDARTAYIAATVAIGATASGGWRLLAEDNGLRNALGHVMQQGTFTCTGACGMFLMNNGMSLRISP